MNELEGHICSSAWTSTETLNNHRELCLQYRGRFSGSADAAGAAEFIEQTLKNYGLETAHRQYYEMVTWARQTAHLEILEPHRTPFPCIALPYSPGCNDTFELVDAGMGHPENLQKIPGGIVGKAVMVSDTNPAHGPHLHRLHKYLAVKKAGAAAFIFVQNQPGMLCPTGSLAFNHSESLDQTIPSLGIPHEVAAEIREWNRRDKVRIRVTMENSLARGRDCNVVADLSSPTSTDQTILVCGHYDGHDIAQGAVDNASGTVVVMETARLLTALRSHLKCNIRFALFGSEELGLVGSHHMADTMDETPENIRFVFNLDCVGAPGRLVMMLQNCPEHYPFFQKNIAELPSDIELSNHLVPFSDHFPFLVRGIPAAFMVTPGEGGRGWGHTMADTFEKVRQETLMRISMHTARLVLRTAQTSHWSSRVKDPDTIVSLLEKHHMRQLMEHEGHWHF